MCELHDPKGTPPCAQVLDEIRAAGFSGTELGPYGFLPTDPSRLKGALSERGLSLVGAFVALPFNAPCRFEEEKEAAIKVAALLSSFLEGSYPVLILSDRNGAVEERVACAGRIRPDQSLPPPAARAYGERVNEVAREVRTRAGLRACFHPHAAGYVETPEEIAALMENTDPDLVGLCLDTGHVAFGGGDAAAMLRQFAPRLMHVHFKDFKRSILERGVDAGWDYFKLVEHGVFCELGQGDVDFRAVVEVLRGLDYRGWIVVEQDVLPGMGTPLESARRNRAFLERLLTA